MPTVVSGERDEELEQALDFIEQAGQRWRNRLKPRILLARLMMRNLMEVRMSSDQGCAPGLIVRDKDWPYGLRCGECSRLLEDGDRYAERLMSMAHEVPVVMIVCVPCDVNGRTYSVPAADSRP